MKKIIHKKLTKALLDFALPEVRIDLLVDFLFVFFADVILSLWYNTISQSSTMEMWVLTTTAILFLFYFVWHQVQKAPGLFGIWMAISLFFMINPNVLHNVVLGVMINYMLCLIYPIFRKKEKKPWHGKSRSIATQKSLR